MSRFRRREAPPREFALNGRVVARVAEPPAGDPRLWGCPAATPAERYAAASWLADLLGCDVETAYSRLWREPNPFERTA